jgi:hypothetical protein
MTKIVVETCSITILAKYKLYIKKCCVDGYNINNLMFYTQQDAVYIIFLRVSQAKCCPNEAQGTLVSVVEQGPETPSQNKVRILLLECYTVNCELSEERTASRFRTEELT